MKLQKTIAEWRPPELMTWHIGIVTTTNCTAPHMQEEEGHAVAGAGTQECTCGRRGLLSTTVLQYYFGSAIGGYSEPLVASMCGCMAERPSATVSPSKRTFAKVKSVDLQPTCFSCENCLLSVGFLDGLRMNVKLLIKQTRSTRAQEPNTLGPSIHA